MAYAIISQMKMHNFGGASVHNNRLKIESNVNPKLTHKNIKLVNFKDIYTSEKNYLETKQLEIAESNKKNNTKNRMVRKGSNYFQELVFTYSPNAMTEKEGIAYCKKALEFIKERFPNQEVMDATIHLDETTPHIHIDLSYFDTKQCKFTQKELMRKKLTDINEIRNAWQDFIKDDFPNLQKQDGSIVKDHEKKADKEKADLRKENAKLKKQIKNEKDKPPVVIEKEKIVEKEVIVEVEKEVIVEKVKRIVDTDKINALQEQINSLEAQIEDWEEKYAKKEQQRQITLDKLENLKDDLGSPCTSVNAFLQWVRDEVKNLKAKNAELKEQLANSSKSSYDDYVESEELINARKMIEEHNASLEIKRELK